MCPHLFFLLMAFDNLSAILDVYAGKQGIALVAIKVIGGCVDGRR